MLVTWLIQRPKFYPECVAQRPVITIIMDLSQPEWGWHPVSIEKLGCPRLLMIISFVLVADVQRGRRLLQGTDA